MPLGLQKADSDLAPQANMSEGNKHERHQHASNITLKRQFLSLHITTGVTKTSLGAPTHTDRLLYNN